MLSRKPELLLYLFGLCSAVLLSATLTYAVRERARRAGLFDPPSERKVHEQQVPRIGGVAIFLAVGLSMALVVWLFGADSMQYDRGSMGVVLAGAALVHLVGLWDDVRPIRARWKFLAQIAIAVAVYMGGLRADTLSLPFVGVVHLGYAFGMLFTVVWLVGITNAFNLIDGLDGLASGAALFALTTMFIVASMNGLVGPALVTIVLAGATLGFLFYNFHPASIFLGDSGSLFLGFMLAGLGLLGSQKSPTVVAVAIPVVSLGLPVLDTLLAVIRRFLRGQPIFTADRAHIHHRLLSLGHSPRRVALLLYGACALLGLSGMLLVNDSAYVAIVLLLIGLGVGVAVQRLRYYEFEEVGRLLRRGARQRSVIGRNVRIREASLRLSDQNDLDTVFTTLEHTFAADEFQCAEVRLRRSFVESVSAAEGPDRRLEDDVPVWSWHRAGAGLAACWEIKLPLLGAVGERIGSLVLWQDGTGSDTSLSHMHTIASDLRHQVERKLVALWKPWADTPRATHEAFAAYRTVPLVIAIERAVHESDPERVAMPDQRPTPKSTPSGRFRLQSAPLG